MRAVVIALAAGLWACSSPPTGTLTNSGGYGDAGHPDFDGGDPDAVVRTQVDAGSLAKPLPDGGPAPTWAYIYATYFGPSTPGHCGDSGCHLIENNHFGCGTTADTCYQGMLATPLIDPNNPGGSRLVNPERTPIIWFDTGGGMPYDNDAGANHTAADEIAAWVYAGAKNN